ncbi:hypothetical protein LCGC14_2759160, partial [marine sediment metagenome]
MPEKSSDLGWVSSLAKIWAVAACILLAIAFTAGTVGLIACAHIERITAGEALLIWIVMLVALPVAGIWVVLV